MIYFLTGWKRWLPCVLGLGLVFFMAPIDAQEQWPSHPVKLVVSSSAGGGTDMYARLLSQALGRPLSSSSLSTTAQARVAILVRPMSPTRQPMATPFW